MATASSHRGQLPLPWNGRRLRLAGISLRPPRGRRGDNRGRSSRPASASHRNREGLEPLARNLGNAAVRGPNSLLRQSIHGGRAYAAPRAYLQLHAGSAVTPSRLFTSSSAPRWHVQMLTYVRPGTRRRSRRSFRPRHPSNSSPNPRAGVEYHAYVSTTSFWSTRKCWTC